VPNAIDLAKLSAVAQSAYAAFEAGVSPLIAISNPQTANFVSLEAVKFLGVNADAGDLTSGGFEFRHHQPNDLIGFSASVFFDRSANKYVLGIRGTEGPADVAEDIRRIGIQGYAGDQLVSLYRYYRKLTTAAGQSVQYSDSEVGMLQAIRLGIPLGLPEILFNGARTLRLRESLAADRGLSPVSGGGSSVIPSGAPVVVTGHSLGGHLALLFGRFFPEVTEHVYTYNAPGIGPQGELALRVMGIPPNLPSQVTNVSAIMGEEAISRIWSKPGEKFGIATEPGDAIHQHSIVPLTDTLALYDAFASLSPDLAHKAADISAIIQAASPFPEDSLEVTLDDLRDIVVMANEPTLIAPSDNTLLARENYFSHLYGMLDVRSPGRDYQIESLVGKSAAEIASMAATDISVRYALDELNPFIARNASYSQFDGEFSGSWIAARAEMLAGVLEGNRLDQPFGLTGSEDSVLYSDIDTGTTFSMLSDAQAQIALPLHRSNQREAVQNALEQATYRRTVVFGSDSSTDGDEIAGLSGNDRLLGGGGADELDGLSGDDFLDGGAGADVLRGGEGDDLLEGGDGQDRMEGGPGQDTYLFGPILDADTIVDRDGRIYAGSSLLTGGVGGVDGAAYQSSDGLYSYEFVGDLASTGTLVINGALTVENFRNGDLGIRLSEVKEPDDVPPPPAGGYLLLGDYDYTGYFDPMGGGSHGYDEYGNPTAEAFTVPYPDRVDIYLDLPGTPGATHYITGGGDDVMQDMVGGDDWLELGSGNDFGWGGSGDDLVEGGAGRDMVAGGRGDDVIYAGTQDSKEADLDDEAIALSSDVGDLLSGGEGDDFLFGDREANLIEGGTGRDQIYAGAGDDWIGSDGANLAAAERYGSRPPHNDWLLREVDLLWHPFRELPTYTLDGTAAFGVPRDASITTGMPQIFFPSEENHDYIDAGAGNDTIFAGPGDDIVFGGGGDDYIDLGLGGDTVSGGAGRDYIVVGQGDNKGDDVEGGDGDDYIETGASSDLLVGGDGDDEISSTGGDDVALGGPGNDHIVLQGEGQMLLAGGPGSDVLIAEKGRDLGGEAPPGFGWVPGSPVPGIPGLFVGFNNRMVLGGGGLATFSWGRGDGFDIGFTFGRAVLQLGDDLAPGDVTVGRADVGATGLFEGDPGAVWVSGFEISVGAEAFTLLGTPGHFGDSGLSVRFADGTVWDNAYLSSIAAAPDQTAEPEIFEGTGAADVLYGGDDGDHISGSLGDDWLLGGAGDDLYDYASGDGFDQIEDADGVHDVVKFASGIGPSDVSTMAIGSDYILAVGDGGVRIRGGRTAEGAVEHVDFADGTRWTLADLEARAEVLPANRAPEMPESFGSVSTDPGNRVEFALPGDAVSDLDRFDEVNLYAITADGDRLPGWLQFDAASRMLSGTPGQEDAGVHELLFIAADASGAAAAGSFTIQVGAGTPAPEPAAPEPEAPAAQVVAESPLLPLQEPAVEPVGADVAVAPTLSAAAPAPRENVFDTLATINAALEAPRAITDSAEPAFRDIQHRLDVLLQTGRTNLGERYAEAIREFEERRLEREEVPEPPPPSEEEIEAWNSAMHAWHDRHQGFAETELGGDGAWGMGWGVSLPDSSLGGARIASLTSLANPALHARLQGVASAPALSEGFQHLR
jgi:Ca2+-binding RTX toxin-like protein